jgi:hypothetical protein
MDNVKSLQETIMAKRLKYIAKLISYGVPPMDMEGLSLVELRDMVDQYEPITITSVSCTASGGTQRSVKVITKKAA